MTPAVVYIGPTLPALHRVQRSGIVVRPPAAQGDILRAVAERFAAILLIDGVFGWEPAVWHKEILWALDRGIRVMGASSMGALRAAELHAYGMEGIGSIFAAYRDGLLEADDEVGVLHGPAEADWLALSDPLVNIRATLARAVRAGLLEGEEARATIELARARFYPERTRASLRADLEVVTERTGRAAAVARWWRAHWVDAKRADAAAAWRVLVRSAKQSVPCRTFTFCRSEPWRRLWRQVHPHSERDHFTMSDMPNSSNDVFPCADNAERRWSLLALVSGDNNLASEILPDATELYSSEALGNIHLLASIDSPMTGLRGDFRLVHRPGGPVSFEFEPKPDRNFGDAVELARLVERGFAGLPAGRRALVVWGHGEGWRVSIDDGSKDALDIAELTGALAAAGIGQERMLDLLVFDACLMGTVENMADLAPYATHVVAAGEVVPSTGLPYRKTIDILGATSSAGDAASKIVDAFIADARERGEGSARLAAVRLDRAGDLLAVLDMVALRLHVLLPTRKSALQAARLMARGCRAGDQVDALDLVRQLAKHTADASLAALHLQLEQACDAAIVRSGQVATAPGCGLNVWFPSQAGLYRRLAPMFQKRADARRVGGEWMRFLASWHAYPCAHGNV